MDRFDLDQFLAECDDAVHEGDRVGAVRSVLEAAASRPGSVRDALGPPTTGSLTVLHHAPDLTVLNVVWTPGMVIEPHDHSMLASIAVYEGGEDNAFFRTLDDASIEPAGGRTLRGGDVAVLGPEIIHRVRADPDRYTGAIHVYAGDFFDRERRTWDETTGAPTQDDRPVAQLFAEAEAARAARDPR
ncbi:hypothetical protein [Actinospongicola halichondriae]|uniref:hypothetical protein n=1 Tax=Actinospongicola halichondriae TaxID=3236844 RepID=UPI003D5CAC7B